jgi:hypothetical protein
MVEQSSKNPGQDNATEEVARYFTHATNENEVFGHQRRPYHNREHHYHY